MYSSFLKLIKLNNWNLTLLKFQIEFQTIFNQPSTRWNLRRRWQLPRGIALPNSKATIHSTSQVNQPRNEILSLPCQRDSCGASWGGEGGGGVNLIFIMKNDLNRLGRRYLGVRFFFLVRFGGITVQSVWWCKLITNGEVCHFIGKHFLELWLADE